MDQRPNEIAELPSSAEASFYETDACDVLLFTTPAVALPGQRVERTLSIVTARRIIGVNAWQDFLIALRDMVGGRSKAAENAFAKMEAELLAELQAKAHKLGAHAVLGVHLQFGEISGKSQMFYGAAQGTPVVLTDSARRAENT